MKNIEKLRAFVHTLQMKSPEGLSEEVMKDKHYLKKGKISCTQRGFLYPINPNEYIGYLYMHSDLKMIMKSIQEELEINEWEYDRIDVAVDSEKRYEDVFKINKYLISLLDLHLKSDSFTDTRGGIKLEKRSLKVWKTKIDVEIYDKNLESEGKHPYTRCEFRFKRLNEKRKENIFNELYEMLDGSKKNIDKLNSIKAESLYQIWCREKESGVVKNINEFCRKYHNEIFTVEISKNLFYKITRKKAEYKDWIANLRRSYKMKFISKRNFDQYIEEIKAAVKVYETN